MPLLALLAALFPPTQADLLGLEPQDAPPRRIPVSPRPAELAQVLELGLLLDKESPRFELADGREAFLEQELLAFLTRETGRTVRLAHGVQLEDGLLGLVLHSE